MKLLFSLVTEPCGDRAVDDSAVVPAAERRRLPPITEA
jgi:hypothetical protein